MLMLMLMILMLMILMLTMLILMLTILMLTMLVMMLMIMLMLPRWAFKEPSEMVVQHRHSRDAGSKVGVYQVQHGLHMSRHAAKASKRALHRTQQVHLHFGMQY